MITINANNATLRENEQSLCALCLCCLAAVRFNGIVQVGKGLKAHESNGFAMAGGGSGGETQPQQGGSVHAVLISVHHKCPLFCCHVQGSQLSQPGCLWSFVAAEAPSSGSRRAGAARELHWAAWEGHTDASLW